MIRHIYIYWFGCRALFAFTKSLVRFLECQKEKKIETVYIPERFHIAFVLIGFLAIDGLISEAKRDFRHRRSKMPDQMPREVTSRDQLYRKISGTKQPKNWL